MELRLKNFDFQADKDLSTSTFVSEQINVSLAFDVYFVSCLETQLNWLYSDI